MRGTLLPIFFFYDKLKCVPSSVIECHPRSVHLFVARDDVKWRDSQPSSQRPRVTEKYANFTKPRFYNREAERIKYGSGRRFTSLLRSLMDSLVTSDNGLR